MKRGRADRLAAIVLGAIGVLGALWVWDLSRIEQTNGGHMNGTMMDGMGTAGGTDPLVVAVGTLVLLGALGGAYLVLREEWTESSPGRPAPEADGADASSVPDSAGPTADPDEPVTASTSRRELLDVLPEDERRIMAPVLESPGLTQIELRDRADFSKSKVSQTVSGLEKRGLLYREKQGRTYRVYPDDGVSDTN